MKLRNNSKLIKNYEKILTRPKVNKNLKKK